MTERDLPTITDALWADLLLDDPNASAGETSPNDAVRMVTSLYSAPTPGAARERARQRVFGSIASDAKENTMTALPTPIPNTGWPVPAALPRKSARRTVDRRWALLSAAAVLVLLLGGVGGYFFGRDRFFGGQGTHYAAIPAATPTADWPMYRGNPGRTGESEGFGPAGQPKELWRVHTGASASRSPAIVDGVAYAGSGDGFMYALDATTGEERWTFQADSGVEITPTVVDGIVYFPSEFGTLFALDASTGEQIWTFDQAISPAATPIVTSGVLFVGADSGTYYALDAATGDVRWQFETDGPVSRSAAFADGVIYTGSEDGNLYALDAANGGELWRFATGADVVGTPSVANGQVYVALPSGDGLYVIDAKNGTE
jgi:outer membrane protein assembly factor BamB